MMSKDLPELRRALAPEARRFRRVIEKAGKTKAWGVAIRKSKEHTLCVEVRGRDSRNRLNGALLLRSWWADYLGRMREEVPVFPADPELLKLLLET